MDKAPRASTIIDDCDHYDWLMLGVSQEKLCDRLSSAISNQASRTSKAWHGFLISRLFATMDLFGACTLFYHQSSTNPFSTINVNSIVALSCCCESKATETRLGHFGYSVTCLQVCCEPMQNFPFAKTSSATWYGTFACSAKQGSSNR